MKKLHTNDTVVGTTPNFTFTTGKVSQIVQIGRIADVLVYVLGDINGGTLTMQFRPGQDWAWKTFYYDATAQTWVDADLDDADRSDMRDYLIGSGEIRFSLATAGSLLIAVAGDYITVRENDYS